MIYIYIYIHYDKIKMEALTWYVRLNSSLTWCYLTSICLSFCQTKKRPSTDFMEMIQKDINASMRSILVDWLVEVHFKKETPLEYQVQIHLPSPKCRLQKNIDLSPIHCIWQSITLIGIFREMRSTANGYNFLVLLVCLLLRKNLSMMTLNWTPFDNISLWRIHFSGWK